jgi:hypothetical protein
MEASDGEDEVPVHSDSLPLGTTFRTVLLPSPQQNPAAAGFQKPNRTFMPRKLSTISSQDRESIPNIDEEEAVDDAFEEPSDTIKAEIHSKYTTNASASAEPEKSKSTTTDFEWHPEPEAEDDEISPETRALLSKKSEDAKNERSRFKNTDV